MKYVQTFISRVEVLISHFSGNPTPTLVSRVMAPITQPFVDKVHNSLGSQQELQISLMGIRKAGCIWVLLWQLLSAMDNFFVD